MTDESGTAERGVNAENASADTARPVRCFLLTGVEEVEEFFLDRRLGVADPGNRVGETCIMGSNQFGVPLLIMRLELDSARGLLYRGGVFTLMFMVEEIL